MIEIFQALIFPAIRSVAGWATKALSDNKVEAFELKELYTTVFRVGAISLAVYFGLTGMDVEIDALSSGAVAFLIDKLQPKVNPNVTRK